MKLMSTRAKPNGKVLVIEFERNIDHVWFDSPKKTAVVLEQVRAHYGADWTVEMVVMAKVDGDAPQPEAVELPAEGDRLEQLAKNILGAQ